MPHPFRLQPPAPPLRALARPRLVEQMARRWDHRVVTVMAGPGFGKTALLTAAMTDSGPRQGREVWLSCESADESAEHLVAGLVEAVGLDPGAGLDAVLAAVWSQAPSEVCIVLDDVHEIPPGSPGAALLGRLARELAANGHLVFGSRDTIPVPLARVAASGQLVRIGEDDLVFDAAELASFAAARDVDPDLLRSTGGWPALAQLVASAGADLVPDYLWEEVLARLGGERARLLAQLAAAGGGDDEMVSALAGQQVSVEEVVASVPLVERSTEGWAVLHALWLPALRALLTGEEAVACRRRAAEVHRRNGRYSAAVDLFVEAEAWDGVLSTIVDAERVSAATLVLADFGRWLQLLPAELRFEPEALLAAGLELQARAPIEAATRFRAAAEGFRAKGDVDAELAAISHDGVVRWWLNDAAGLMDLYVRVGELRATGSARARVLEAVGLAALAHLQGDSAGVLSALARVDDASGGEWFAVIRWLASVAHRRDGDLERALDELDRAFERSDDPQFHIARLRVEWLQGRVDHVVRRLGDLHAANMRSGDRFLARESGLELAAKLAWLGDVATARALVDAAPELPDVPSVLARVLSTIASAAIAVHEGDEPGAAAILGKEITAGDAALGRPESWFWRDRAAVALAHMLVPGTRALWAAEPLGAPHRPGLALAETLEAARDGDLRPARALSWPEIGIVRAHLPVRWIAELAAAATAARNPPPDDLLDALGPAGPPALRAVASMSVTRRLATAATSLAHALPVLPTYRLRIGALGTLQLWRDGVAVEHRELRRQRVRELLCYLIVHRRARREAVGEELWPDVADPGQNLRVTLNYLQTVLQPERARDDRPYFLRAGGTWLELAVDDRLEIDAWHLEARLEEAEAAERAGAVATALAAYRAALPLWQGEPFADVPYAPWADAERTRLRTLYVAAAIRAGELLLAAPAVRDALRAAELAIVADRASEPAYRLLARAHLANHDQSSARDALEGCRDALAELAVGPDAETATLLASLSHR